MAWQLIYTSAPRLLEAGRTGFGTIARHRDIPTLLVQTVERFSQFARLPGLDPHRVIYCHRKVHLSSGSYHVLSMIRSAGSDHTGRTNDIAHHLIATELEAAECATAGVTPADIMLGHNWLGSWGQPPRWLDDTEMVKLDSTPPYDLQYSNWVPLTNNPKHAWLLVTNPAGRSCHLIAPTGVDMRLIFLESLRVMGSESWQATFTTSAEPTDDNGDFRWIACATGSRAASSVNSSGRQVLDLTKPDTLPQPEAPQVITAPAESVATEMVSQGSIQDSNLSLAEQPAVSTRDAHGNYRDQVKLRLPAPSAAPLPIRQGSSAMTEGRRDFGVVPHPAGTLQGTIEKKERRQPSKLTLTLIGSALVVVATILAYPEWNKYIRDKKGTKPNGNVAVVNGTDQQAAASVLEKTSTHTPPSVPLTPKNQVSENSKQATSEIKKAVPIPVATPVSGKSNTSAMASNNTPTPKTPETQPLAESKPPKPNNPANSPNLKTTRSVYLVGELFDINLPIKDPKDVSIVEIEKAGVTGVSKLKPTNPVKGFAVTGPIQTALLMFIEGKLVPNNKKLIENDEIVKSTAEQIRKMVITLADGASITVIIVKSDEVSPGMKPLLGDHPYEIKIRKDGSLQGELFTILKMPAAFKTCYLKCPKSIHAEMERVGKQKLRDEFEVSWEKATIGGKANSWIADQIELKKKTIKKIDTSISEKKKLMADKKRDDIERDISKLNNDRDAENTLLNLALTLQANFLLGGSTVSKETYASVLYASWLFDSGPIRIPLCNVTITQE
jgi:hypothetical protein